jgi:SP family facilitated glucose transporter-like MFS transporter 8
MSVIATYVSTLVVDKLGRKILLLSSIIVMGICTLLIGAFFYMKVNNYNVSSIGLIPLVSMCLFIILFSLGFGPIPWMLIGEIFPAQIKGNTLLPLLFNGIVFRRLDTLSAYTYAEVELGIFMPG